MGRTERLDLRLEPELMKAIDDWRRGQEDLPNRSEAIRRLLERGIAASAEAAAPKRRKI